MTQMTIQQAVELGMRHHQSGQLQQAEAVYRQILLASPNQPQALHLMGMLALQMNRLDVALHLIRRAIAVNPNEAAFYGDLGRVLAASGQAEQAIEAFGKAVSLAPASADAWFNLGLAMEKNRRFDGAVSAYQKAISFQPNAVDALNNLGNSLRESGRLDEAIIAYHRAIELRPDYVEAQMNLGNALKELGRTSEAIAAFGKAVALKPDFAQGHNNLGIALLEAGRVDDAVTAHRRAIELQPDWALAHYNLGLALLLRGDFQNGLTEHEWRLRADELGTVADKFPQPKWDGSDLNGKRILLHVEQGFGDAIQFVRYAPKVSQRGGRVVIQCHPELVTLFQCLEGIEEVVARGTELPGFDLHCPLLSLPLVMGTRLETIPSTTPYLRADAELSSRWRERLPNDGLKVGLVWSGLPTHPRDRIRSIPLSKLSALAPIPKVNFISLNKNRIAQEKREFELLDWTDELHDFAETAALIENLDLVISIDTAVAHLAGAMGKPVWVLLPLVPDWRWMLDRDDSPWYPSMKLFRQASAGDWDGPVERIAQELSTWISRRQP